MEEETECDVLLIDDDPVASLLLHKMLGYHGYRVRVAPRPEEASPILERGVPPVIILDLLMPGADGFSVLDDLRAKWGLEDSLILIHTAKEFDPREKEKMETRYGCRVLEKLTDQQLLISLVGSRLKEGSDDQR